MNVHDSERISGLLDEAGYVAGGRGRPSRPRRLQHLRRARERRQQALRQPRPPQARQGRAPRHADRGRRLPGAEGPGDASSSGRRYVDVVFGTHNVGVAAGAARAGPHRGSGPGRAARVARGLPVDAARPARVDVRRLGVDQRRLRQHLHLLHRAVAARQGGGPPAGRRAARGRGARRAGRARGDAARAERQLLRPLLRRPRRPSPSCCAPSGRDRPRAGPLHQPAPARLHRRRHRRDGRDARGLPVAAHAAAVRLRRRARGDAPLLPVRALPRHPRPGPRRRSRTPRSPPTSSSASPARPTPTSRRPCASSRPPASPAPSPSSTPRDPAPRPRDCPTRCRPRSSPSATSGSSRCRTRITYDGMRRAGRPRRSRCSSAAGEGRKDAPGRLTGRARDNRLVHLAGVRRRAPRRRRHDRGHRRRPALPGGRRRAARPPAHPRPVTPGSGSAPPRAGPGRRRRPSACRRSACLRRCRSCSACG